MNLKMFSLRRQGSGLARLGATDPVARVVQIKGAQSTEKKGLTATIPPNACCVWLLHTCDFPANPTPSHPHKSSPIRIHTYIHGCLTGGFDCRQRRRVRGRRRRPAAGLGNPDTILQAVSILFCLYPNPVGVLYILEG